MPANADPIQRLQEACHRFEVDLSDAIAQRAQLDKRIEELRLKSDVAVQIFAEVSSGAPAPPRDGETPSFPVLGKYSKSTLKEAVMDVLKEHAGNSVKPKVISDTILRNGFQTKSGNLPVMVRNTCKRLVQAGDVVRGG